MGTHITKHHLEFLDEARHVFQKNILRETHINEAGDLIALRYGADRDCIKIFELGDEVAFFAQMIHPTDGNQFIQEVSRKFTPQSEVPIIAAPRKKISTCNMDIYAKNGARIVFLDRNGYETDRVRAKERGLVEGAVYTVDRVDVGRFHSHVYLEEFPEVSFNTVMFCNVEDYEVANHES